MMVSHLRGASILFGAWVALSPPYVSAVDWKQYFVNQAGVRFSLDSSSMVKTKEGNVRAWERQEWANEDPKLGRGFLWLIEVDCRPSDAIALAVRAQVPIFADEAVLEKAGVRLDEEGQGLEALTGETVEGPKEASPEELEKLSPFRDVIEGLDLDDFDKK